MATKPAPSINSVTCRCPDLSFKRCLLPTGLKNDPKRAQGRSQSSKERTVHGWPTGDDGHQLMMGPPLLHGKRWSGFERKCSIPKVGVEVRLRCWPGTCAWLHSPTVFFNAGPHSSAQVCLCVIPYFRSCSPTQEGEALVRKGTRQLLGRAGLQHQGGRGGSSSQGMFGVSFLLLSTFKYIRLLMAGVFGGLSCLVWGLCRVSRPPPPNSTFLFKKAHHKLTLWFFQLGYKKNKEKANKAASYLGVGVFFPA